MVVLYEKMRNLERGIYASKINLFFYEMTNMFSNELYDMYDILDLIK